MTADADRSPDRNVSPLDGRYRRQTAELADRLSEWALMRPGCASRLSG
jgi:hypothetical protein